MINLYSLRGWTPTSRLRHAIDHYKRHNFSRFVATEPSCCYKGHLYAMRSRQPGLKYAEKRTQSTVSTSINSSYFNTSFLPDAADTEKALRYRKLDDLEDAWARAHRNLSQNEGDEASEAHLKHIEEKIKVQQAAMQNARLSFDDEPGSSNAAHHLGQGYRDLIMRCTTLDSSGNVQRRNQPVAKSTLCSRYGLQQRDLRKVDSRLHNTIPTILVRKEAILLNILHIRMLVTANTVILFDAIGTMDSSLHQKFVQSLSNLKAGYRGSGGLPYEFRALEAALTSISEALEVEMTIHRDMINKLVSNLERHIEAGVLRDLLQHSRGLSNFQKRAKSVQAAIDEVLEQDDDLSAMYLSEGAVRPRATDDHQEVEMLLESFSKQVEEIVSEVDSLVANVHQTQDVIELILDSSRNSLLALDLKVTVGTMGLASGAFIAGLFGMNLTTTLEQTPYAFAITTGVAACVVAVITVGGLAKVNKLRRIGLGQGVFGDYSPHKQYQYRNSGGAAWRKQAYTSDVYGRKASYHDSASKRRAHNRWGSGRT